jgi:hypothetical protein
MIEPGRSESPDLPAPEEKSLLIEEWIYHCRQRKWTLRFEGGTLRAITQGGRLEYDGAESALRELTARSTTA